MKSVIYSWADKITGQVTIRWIIDSKEWESVSYLYHTYLFIFIYLGFTAQVLKVCRTPGPTAY